jgi:hypothetical protein
MRAREKNWKKKFHHHILFLLCAGPGHGKLTVARLEVRFQLVLAVRCERELDAKAPSGPAGILKHQVVAGF